MPELCPDQMGARGFRTGDGMIQDLIVLSLAENVLN